MLSKDAGSGLASSNLPPHLSVIKVSVLNLQHRVGREGFSEPPGQGQVPAWEQECSREACRGEPHGTSCSPSACLTPRQGKLRHGLPLLPAWQSEPGAHPHCKPDTLSGFFLYTELFFHVPKPLLFCKLRVFCKRREGEVLQVQKTCTCFLKPSLTSGPGDCAAVDAFPFLPGKPRVRCHSSCLGGRKGHPCHEFAWAQLRSGRKGRCTDLGEPRQGAGTSWGGECKTPVFCIISLCSAGASALLGWAGRV